MNNPETETAAPARLNPRGRQAQVLTLYVTGNTRQQTATALGIAESTVKEHLKRIRAFYSAQNRSDGSRADLIRCAREDGFI